MSVTPIRPRPSTPKLATPAGPAPAPAPTSTPTPSGTYSVGGSEAARRFASPPPAVTGSGELAASLRAQQATANVGIAGGDAGAPSPALERAARRTYARNGATSYDLSNPAQRRALIQNSPQIDNLSSVPNDRTRCGGAAVANSLLLDGNNAGNAEAIRRTARDLGVNLSDRQRAAVDALGNGRMTPNQAAELQNTMLQLGAAQRGTAPRGDSADGLTLAGMADLTTRLRQNGGFANTQKVQYRLSYPNPGEPHWTVVHQDRAGQWSHADSWPGRNGQATVGTGYTSAGDRTIGGAPNARWAGDFTLMPQNGQNYVEARFGDSNDNGRFNEIRATIPAGQFLPLERYQRTLQRDQFDPSQISVDRPGTPWTWR